MTMSNRAKNLFLHCIFPKYQIEAIFILPIIDHILIIPQIRRYLTGSKPTIHFDISTFLPIHAFLLALIFIRLA